MKQINQWDELPGLTIDSIDLGSYAHIRFEPNDRFINIAPQAGDNLRVYFYQPTDAMPGLDFPIDPKALYGKTIWKLVVTFFDEGAHGESGIIFVFDDMSRAVLAPEDGTSPLRIT